MGQRERTLHYLYIGILQHSHTAEARREFSKWETNAHLMNARGDLLRVLVGKTYKTLFVLGCNGLNHIA